MFYIWREAALRRKRPELFEDIDEDEHVASWTVFAMGTAGLIVCCYLMNVMFLVASDLYSPFLSKLFGAAVFAMIHFFLGALVTSLPEMNVAVSNYQRIESPDLNTALASASASNMSNLAIAGIGCMIALLF
jgi:purine-cytosine permease-like protein